MAASLRRQALQIFRAALQSGRSVPGRSAPPSAPTPRLTEISYVIGAGKASAQMARAVERLLGARITAGLINVKDGHGAKLRRIKIKSVAIPSLTSAAWLAPGASRKLRARPARTTWSFALISGGASALLPFPAPPITLAAKQKITRSLLDCGASIHEINCVRKHISRDQGRATCAPGLSRYATHADSLGRHR